MIIIKGPPSPFSPSSPLPPPLLNITPPLEAIIIITNLYKSYYNTSSRGSGDWFRRIVSSIKLFACSFAMRIIITLVMLYMGITLMTTMMLMMMTLKMHLKNVFKSWSSDLNKSLPGSRHHPDQDHHNHHHPDHHHCNNDNCLLGMIFVIRSNSPLEGYDGLSQLFNHMNSTTF